MYGSLHGSSVGNRASSCVPFRTVSPKCKMNRKIEVIENKEVGRKKMSLSYVERDNFQNDG